MCSNKCANPVRPGFSYIGPTWYHRFTATRGRRWSSERMTSSPFASLYFSYVIWGQFPAAPGVAAIDKYDTTTANEQTKVSKPSVLRMKTPKSARWKRQGNRVLL